MRKKYQIKLINTQTKEALRTGWIYTNRKKAQEFVDNWKAQGDPFDAEIVVITK